MEEARSTTTPVNSNPESTKLGKHTEDEKDATRYGSIVGSLYNAMKTRTDLCVAAISLGTHVDRSCQVHFVAANCPLPYSKGTMDHSLM